ncbi:MAG: EstA family serine hydrolase, partial [Myxococcaceae bacterium]|nr:EstA family serine hydrolase [Myxococcaceae bacterium]
MTIDGKPVVDLWGGLADKDTARAWEKDTLVNVFSTTKGFTAMCAHRLVDQGLLDLEAPVAQYWPELARHGKEAIRVRWLLDHRAGLPAVKATLPPEALFDWTAMTSALAAEAPWWTPGTQHGYHAVTFGWLVGEVIRRASGRTMGAYFRDEIARPLGLDVHVGLDPKDDARCAELRPGRKRPNESTLFDRIMSAPDSMTAKAFTNPIAMVMPGTVGSRAFRAAELPSVNGHATARSIARLYGVLACGGEQDGVRVLSGESIDRARTESSSGLDAVLGVSTRFGLGFMLSQPEASFGPSAGAFGHPGAGGSIGFADPECRVGFSYVMNRMGSSLLLDP